MNSTLFAGIALLAALPAVPQQRYTFQDPTLDIEKRIDNVLSLMTLDEKIDGLGTSGVAVQRLGIPGTPIGEALSGVAIGGPIHQLVAAIPQAPADMRATPIPTTQFPQGIGLAHTWDPDLVRRAGDVIGSEARYIVENKLNPKGFLVLLTPNADLSRDPRWGRTQETYGEDPFFNGAIAVALIKGIQGNDPRYWQAASLLKHFLANSNEADRYGSSSDFDERLLREYYSVPFRMGFVEGGAKCFMASYNAWNKKPMTVHPMLRDIAMKEWGVDGIICTDAGSLANLVSRHKAYASLSAAAAASVKAGINMFLTVAEDYKKAVRGALDERLLTEADIDAALRGSIRTQIRLGLLDPPELVPYTRMKGEPNPVNSPEHNMIARQVARESIVLLKNSNNLLPLSRGKLTSVAIIGKLANEVLPDFYGGTPPYAVTPLEGIKNALRPHTRVTYAVDNTGGAAAKAAAAADVAIVVVGNHPTCNRTPQQLLMGLLANKGCEDPGESMEGADRTSLALRDEDLVKAVYAANPKTVVVLVSSGPYAINWTQENVPAILHTSHNGQEEGNGIADVLFGDYNPAGRLTRTWVRSIDQLPPMMDYNLRHGRTYMYYKGDPLYAFGHGLSYTTFSYRNLRASSATLKPDGQITISVDVKNEGPRDGDEVVQFYVRHMGSKVERPEKELKGFARVAIRSGRTQKVTVPLKASDLAYWNEAEHRWVVEAEPVKLMVGASSADIRLERTIRVAQ